MTTNANLLDDGLRAVMGADRCRDMTTEIPEKKTVSDGRNHDGTAREEHTRTIFQPVDASWFPLKPTADMMQRLKSCCLSTLKYALISVGTFLAQRNGLIDPVIATPVTLFCAAMCGISIGRISTKKG